MDSRKRKNWAAMCGAIRYEFDFYTTLSYLVELRFNGELDGIVLSTWVGEIDKISGLREKLKQLDIYVVETPPVDECYSGIFMLGYLRQGLQLRNALKIIPKDSFVLKCRTDMALHFISCFRYLLTENIDFSIRNYGCFPIVFSHRVAVQFLSITLPFVSRDIVFYGHCSDINKMCSLNAHKFSRGRLINPDYGFFVSPFFEMFPYISDYFYYYSGVDVSKLLIQKREKEKILLLPNLLRKLYANLLMIYYSHFMLIWNGFSNMPINFNYIFSQNYDKTKRTVKDWTGISIYDGKVIEDIVRGEVVSSGEYASFHEELIKFAAPRYAQNLNITKEDYDGFNDFLSDCTPPNPWWKTQYTIVESLNIMQADYKNAINLLFSDYKLEDRLINIFQDAFKQTNPFEKLTEYLPQLKEMNIKLYEQTIITIAKNNIWEIGSVIGLAQIIYNGEISTENITAAESVMERWQKAIFSIYKFGSQVLSLSYYWSAHLEKSAKESDIPKFYYDELKKKWELADIPDRNANFSQGIIELAQTKLSRLREESSFDDTLVSIIEDFLAEVSFKINSEEVQIQTNSEVNKSE